MKTGCAICDQEGVSEVDRQANLATFADEHCSDLVPYLPFLGLVAHAHCEGFLEVGACPYCDADG